MSCDIDLRKGLFETCVLSGATTMFPGFKQRLTNEMKELLVNQNVKPKIMNSHVKNRKYDVWIGGSVLSLVSTFEQMWVDKNEYDESGPGIVNRKCW